MSRMHVRSVHDPVLGVITTAELQSRLDAHDSKMSTAARVKDTPETRALHFSNNGTQNRQSLEAIQARGTFPQERIEKLIERHPHRRDFLSTAGLHRRRRRCPPLHPM